MKLIAFFFLVDEQATPSQSHGDATRYIIATLRLEPIVIVNAIQYMLQQPTAFPS